MFLIRPPSASDIQAFLDHAQSLPLSYDTPGMVMTPPAGFTLDEQVVVIGHGREDFDRARQALMAWKQFDFGWVKLFSSKPSPEPGSALAVLIRHLGFWSLNGGRVLTRTQSTGDRPSFAFTYGTLSDHAECGDELFEVFLDLKTDEVKYRIRAVSRPRALLARLGTPFARVLQARFRRDSAGALKRSTKP